MCDLAIAMNVWSLIHMSVSMEFQNFLDQMLCTNVRCALEPSFTRLAVAGCIPSKLNIAGSTFKSILVSSFRSPLDAKARRILALWISPPRLSQNLNCASLTNSTLHPFPPRPLFRQRFNPVAVLDWLLLDKVLLCLKLNSLLVHLCPPHQTHSWWHHPFSFCFA